MKLFANRMLPITIAIFMALTLPAGKTTAEPVITTSVSPSYFSGDFGTAHTTDIFYLPLYLKYKNDDLGVKLTVPYISVRSNGAVVAGGTVIGKGTAATKTTHSGLGDIWLEGKYTLHHLFDTVDLIPYAKVKFGTASHAKGLGTGEQDYEFGTGIKGRIGTNMFPFARIGYRIVGQPANVTLDNIMTYRVGVSYVINHANVFTVLFSGRQASQPGFQAAADLIAAWNYNLRPNLELQAFGDKGLSNGSPNYGAGISVLARF